jgi:predicted small secreted protein
MPGARMAKTVMIIVAVVVVAGLLAAMVATPGAVVPN